MGFQEFVEEKLRLRNDSFLVEDFPPATEGQSRFLELILAAIDAGVEPFLVHDCEVAGGVMT